MVEAVFLSAIFLGALLGAVLTLVSVLCGHFISADAKRSVARWTNVAGVVLVVICAYRIIAHAPYDEEGGPYYISPTGELRLDLIGSVSAAIVTLALTSRVAFGARS
jgi:putative Mn2+ efflux pump MntP